MATAVSSDILDCTPFDRNRGDGLAEFECRFLDPEGKATKKGGSITRVSAGLLSGRQEKVEFEIQRASEMGPLVTIRYPIVALDLVSKFDFVVGPDGPITSAGADSRELVSFVVTDSGRSLALSNDAFSLGVDLAQCASTGFKAMWSIGSADGAKCPDGALVTLVSEDSSSGRSAAMACCPLETPELLRLDQVERRANGCASDEVVTGIASLRENILFCAKLDPKKAILGEEYPAIFISGEPSAAESVKFSGAVATSPAPIAVAATDLVSSMAALAQGFSGRDTMACSPNSVMISRIRQLVQVGDISIPVALPVCRSLAPVKR
jgi:hypothetical protein